MNPGQEPAFPVATIFNPVSGEPANTGQYWNGNGLSKREYFAAMAMQGVLIAGAGVEHYPANKIASNAVIIADALIAELGKTDYDKTMDKLSG